MCTQVSQCKEAFEAAGSIAFDTMAPHIDNLESGVLNPDPSPVVARCSHAYIPCNTARIETPIQPLPHSTRDASAVVAAERCCHANAAAPAAAMPGARMMMHAYMSIQLCMHHHTCARHRCGRGGSVGAILYMYVCIYSCMHASSYLCQASLRQRRQRRIW